MPRLDWFCAARYGMIIHWGPYSVAARGEWVRNRERIDQDEYSRRYAEAFTAVHYDPREWARLAKASGMGYVVLTARHHDGFCLWDTRTTDFNAARIGPKRDLLLPFVEAIRAEGLKVGFYYSVADWHHPDYPTAYARDWPRSWPDPQKRDRFFAYCRAQLEELMTGYGTIDVLWYDGCLPGPSDAEANRRVHALQPDILINERNGEPSDFRVAEQTLVAKPGAWEAVFTLNDNWGFHAGDHQWKSPLQVIRHLIACARSGGNLLLNIGPRGDGSVPAESIRILRESGDWLRRNREFLPHSDRCAISWNNWGLVSSRGKMVYLHLFNSPGNELCFAELSNRVQSARFVDGGNSVAFEQHADRLFLRGLPTPLPDPIATTIAIELDSEPLPLRHQEAFWIPA